jgi:outer membrane murein-binding lipoprotein Lpp
MKYVLLSTLAALVLAGCASKSQDVTAAYVSPVAYQSFTCDQLQQEAEGVSARAAVAAGQQDKARKNDQLKTAVGVVLFWPVLLFNEGDGQNAAELSNLKGQMNAIQAASTKKKCGFTFQS